MLNITFEFVGGPNDGKIVEGRLGEPSDAERHYLFSHHGRLGQRFSVASDWAVEALGEDPLAAGPIPRHYYVVTERLEDAGEVWVQATYAPSKADAPAPEKLTSSDVDEDFDETEDYDDGLDAAADEAWSDDFDDDEDSSDAAESPAEKAKSAGRDLDGYLLIASPRMADEWFGQSVVLVLDQSDEETFGVILNRPTPETVSDLWREVGDVPCASDDPVFAGGPADGPVMVLHQDETEADIPVVPQVFLSVEKEHLESLVHQDHRPQRLFVGTSGWAAGQLEREIAHGDWLLLPATNELIFASPEEQWALAMREFGRSFYRSIGVRHVPDDARAN